LSGLLDVVSRDQDRRLLNAGGQADQVLPDAEWRALFKNVDFYHLYIVSYPFPINNNNPTIIALFSYNKKATFLECGKNIWSLLVNGISKCWLTSA
jgi:hypothetical protein